MIAEKDPYIDSAYRQLQLISQDKQMRMEYEAREKAIRDHNEMMYEARERGREEGRKEGIENTAKKMLALGFPAEAIAQVTGMQVAQILGSEIP